MATYEVTALGDFRRVVEADSQSDAERKALQALKEEYEHTVGVNAIKAYEVTFHLDRTHANVLASSSTEARENARQWVNDKIDRAMNGANQDARDILQELSTDVTVEGVSANTHYEIDRDGRWNEGDLEEITADEYVPA